MKCGPFIIWRGLGITAPLLRSKYFAMRSYLCFPSFPYFDAPACGQKFTPYEVRRVSKFLSSIGVDELPNTTMTGETAGFRLPNNIHIYMSMHSEKFRRTSAVANFRNTCGSLSWVIAQVL